MPSVNEEIDIKFQGKMLPQCNFIKTTSKGNKKTFEISVSEKDKINRVVKEKVIQKEEKPKKNFIGIREDFEVFKPEFDRHPTKCHKSFVDGLGVNLKNKKIYIVVIVNI